MGGVERMACQGFLVRGACVCVLVVGAGSLLLWNALKYPVLSFGVSMGLANELLSANVPWNQEFSGVLEFGF